MIIRRKFQIMYDALNVSKDTNHFIKWYNESSFEGAIFFFNLNFIIKFVTDSIFFF